MNAFVTEIFDVLQKNNPHPKTELSYHNNYTLLIAVVLSAQSTDKGVNKATHALFQEVATPEEMLTMGEEKLREHIKTIGLYRNKAKNVIKLSALLVEKFQSQVPQNRQDLESLPGVGRKTANVVLNVAFHAPTIPVDTHIFRVSKRLGLAKGNTPLAVEEELLSIIPARFIVNAHHWLILHGRYVCKARTPQCTECAVKKWCTFYGAEKNALTLFS